MPKIVRMPKLKEMPIHARESDRADRHGRFGWFMRGFAAAVLLFGFYVFFGGYYGVTATHDQAGTIIVGD